MTNRTKLIGLREQFDLTQTEVANIIAKQTSRPCALRTVQSWEALPEKTSARGCPDWAVEILAKYLAKHQQNSKHKKA